MTTDDRVEAAKDAWRELQNRYGAFEVIDDPKNLPEVDERRIWTEFWGQDQFISNTFVEVEEFDSEITSYYVFEKPYIEAEDSLNVITTFWDDCEDCGGEDEECESCEGQGTIAIDFL